MTAAATSTLYAKYRRFAASRITAWKPKVYQNLLQMIENATDEPTIERAISRLDENMLKPSGLSITIMDIYKDAGRVWGAHVYQIVKQQADKYREQAERKKAMMPIGYNEELVNEIIAYMRLHNLQLVSQITDTMKAWIFEKLVEGQRQGLSIRQVAENMVNDDLPAYRSLVIARTETIKAANVGAVQGAKKTGVLTEKLWIAAQDFRTRRIPRDEFSHAAMHLQTAPIDQPFLVPNINGSHDPLMQPGDPSGEAGDVIQCRCTVGFNVIRDARGLPVLTGGAGILPTIMIKPPVIVPPKPIEPPKVFKPAKTIKEAEDYTKNVIGVKYANFKGISIDIANDINKSVFTIKEVMPKIRTNGIGSAQQANKDLKAKIVEAYKKGSWYKTVEDKFGKEPADKPA